MIDKWHLQLFAYIIDSVPDPKRIVEIGVHKGETLRWMRDYTGARVMGVDPYPGMSTTERDLFIKKHVSDIEIYSSGIPEKVDIVHYDAQPKPDAFRAAMDGLAYKLTKNGLIAIDNFDTRTPSGASLMTHVLCDMQNFPFTVFCIATDKGWGRAYACHDTAYQQYWEWLEKNEMPKFIDHGCMFFDSRFRRNNKEWQKNARKKWP